MKGDANKDFDPINITNSNIIGKVRLTIPYLGYLASYAKKPWGFILLVIVPATILIYEELKTLFDEAKKGAKKALHKFNHRTRDIKLSNIKSLKEDYVIRDLAIESSINRGILSKIFKSLSYFIPIFGAVLIFISFSASFFSDKEKTAGNQFQASSSFPETVILENKKVTGDWSVINDATFGTLKYDPIGPTFNFVFNGEGLTSGKDFCLIYYADPWPGNHPGYFFGSAVADDNGYLTISGNKDIGMDMPSLPDTNFPTGAKFWLVPCNQYDVSSLSTGWQFNETEWLFEGWVKYTRVVPTSTPIPTPTPTQVDEPPSPSSTTIIINQLGGDIGNQYGYWIDYSNAANNNVFFTYNTPSIGKLSGTIQGTGLKPYATYQVKLSGIPTCKDPVNGNDAANEYIGYKGRWTCVSSNCSSQSASERNRSDSQYEANKSKSDSDTTKECLVSYLVFDHFTADSGGNASKSIQTSNSFHVLGCDGSICGGIGTTFITYPDSSHSTVAFCPSGSVDGQLERGSCGGLNLNIGNYHLEMSLTEESFHLGNWATVLYGNIDFVIQ